MTVIPDDATEIVDAKIPRVDLVKSPAHGQPFLIAKSTVTGSTEHAIVVGTPADVAKAQMTAKAINDLPDSDFAYIEPGGSKDETGKTTPRSKRHFPIHDAAHVRNALARAPQSPFGDKALPKIHAAAKKFGIDVAKAADAPVDGLDPTVTLAETGDVPGDPTEPGSPAWEEIDAATAVKWTAILARARHALETLRDREEQEAVTVDPGDVGSAMDLQTAACAVDCAISILAPFAVDEQLEADTAAEQLSMIGKAAASLEEPLTVIEGLATVVKAGRVLSGRNEQAIRTAIESLSAVLDSLPKAEEAPMEKTVEPTAPVEGADVTKADPAEPDTAAAEVEKSETDPTLEPETEVTKTEDEPVEKADAELVAVYDKAGCLIGVVAPDSITAVEQPDEPEPEAEPEPETDPAAVNPDDAGEPTDTMAKADIEALIAKAAETAADNVRAEMTKALEDQKTEHTSVVDELRKQITALEEAPDPRSRVLSNGAVPPAEHLRGQDTGGVAKAAVEGSAELRKAWMEEGDANQQKVLADQMTDRAHEALAAIHAHARRG